MEWNEKVKTLMKERSINQKQLAALSGITESSVCRYLKGNRTPRIDIITNFAKALNVDVEYLLEETETISAYDTVFNVIARNGKELTYKEKEKLSKILLEEN